jgi:hypothetical protein
VPASQEVSPQQRVKTTTIKQQEQKKEAIQVRKSCTALFLSYNKIESIETLPEVVHDIMLEPERLMWLDLSHNRLTSLDCELGGFRALKTLYLHCNYLHDSGELLKLRLLPSLTMLMIHANPLEKIPEFRTLLIGLLEGLVKIDSVLVSPKERSRAYYLLDSLPTTKTGELKLPRAKREEPPPSDDEDSA